MHRPPRPHSSDSSTGRGSTIVGLCGARRSRRKVYRCPTTVLYTGTNVIVTLTVTEGTLLKLKKTKVSVLVSRSCGASPAGSGLGARPANRGEGGRSRPRAAGRPFPGRGCTADGGAVAARRPPAGEQTRGAPRTPGAEQMWTLFLCLAGQCRVRTHISNRTRCRGTQGPAG